MTENNRHSKNRQRALTKSVFSSMASKVLTVALSLVSVPIALDYLGKSQYGLWATISSVIGLLVFADLGVGNGVMNSAATANGRDDHAAVRRAVVSGVSVVLAAGALLLLSFMAIWPFVDWKSVLAIADQSAVSSAALAVLVLVVLFSLNMPISVIQKIQYGTQNGHWVSISLTIAAVLGFIFILLTVNLGFGLVGMVASGILAAMLADLIVGWHFFRRFSNFRPRLSDWNYGEASQLLRIGLGFLVLQVGVSICYASDYIILAQIVGLEAVADFQVHQKLFSPLMFVAGMVLTPLWAAFADANSRGDIRWIKKTLVVASVSMFLIGVLGGGLIFLLADWLMLHWLKGRIQADHLLCLGFMFWVTVDLVGRSIAMFLNGAGLLKQQLIIVLLFVPICIGLKIVLTHQMGSRGILLGTAIAWLVVHLPAYTWLLITWFRSSENESKVSV